jgi:hypothetical protein
MVQVTDLRRVTLRLQILAGGVVGAQQQKMRPNP